ncbi:MAG: VWA domain-containing protein [Oscillospiraceae bacterium]|nr:VWA domain-containing protein [Oscillospiraceae bacterium]
MKKRNWINFISLVLAMVLSISPVASAAETMPVQGESGSHTHVLTVEEEKLEEILEQNLDEALVVYSFEKAAPSIVEEPAEEPEAPAEEPEAPAEEKLAEGPASDEVQVAGAVVYSDENDKMTGEPAEESSAAITVEDVLSRNTTVEVLLDRALVPYAEKLDLPFGSAMLKEQILRELEGKLLVAFYDHEDLGCESCQAIAAVDPVTRQVIAVGINKSAQQHAFVLDIVDHRNRSAELANVSVGSTELAEKELSADELASALENGTTEVVELRTAAEAPKLPEAEDLKSAEEPEAPASEEKPAEEPEAPAFEEKPAEEPEAPAFEEKPAEEPEVPASEEKPEEEPEAPASEGKPEEAPEVESQVAGAFVVYAEEEKQTGGSGTVTGAKVIESTSSNVVTGRPQSRAASGFAVMAASPVITIPTVSGGETVLDTFFAEAVGNGVSGFNPTVSGNTLTLTKGRGNQYQTGAINSSNKVDLTKSFVLRSTLQLSNAADGIAIVLHNDPNGTSAVGGDGHGLGVYAAHSHERILNALVIEHDNSRNVTSSDDYIDEQDLNGYSGSGYSVWEPNTVHLALHATGNNRNSIRQRDYLDRYVFTTQDDVDAIKGAVSSVLYWQAAGDPAVSGSDSSYHLVYQLTDAKGDIRQLSATLSENQVRTYFGLDGADALMAYIGYTAGTNYNVKFGSGKTDCSVTFDQFAYLGYEPETAILITEANGAAKADMPAQDSSYKASAGDVLTVKYTFQNSYNFTGTSGGFPSHIKLGSGYANIDFATISDIVLDGVPQTAATLTAGDGLPVSLENTLHTLTFKVTVAKTTSDFGSSGKVSIPLVLTADGMPQAFTDTATTGTAIIDPGSELTVSKTAEAKDAAGVDDPTDPDYRTYRIDLGGDYSGTTLSSKALDIVLVIDRSGSMQYRGSGDGFNKSNYTLLGQFKNVKASLDTTKEYYYFRTQKNSTNGLTSTDTSDAEMNGRMSYSAARSKWQYGDGSTTNNTVGENDYIWVRKDRMSLVKDAVEAFIDQVPAGSRVGVVSFSSSGYGDGTTHVDASYNSYQLLDVAAHRSLIKEGANSLMPLGGTQTNSGLGVAYDILTTPSKWEPVSTSATERKKVVVLLTDGIYNGTDPMQEAGSFGLYSWPDGYARQIKNAGMELYVAGIDVETSTASTMKNWASGVTEEEKAKYYATVSTDGASGLNEMFKNLSSNLFGSMSGTVRDYIDPRFDLVDKNGTALVTGDWITKDGVKTVSGADNAVGQVKYDSDRSACYVEWVTDIGHDDTENGGEDESWSASLYVKAKDKYVGNNNVPTNGDGSGVYYVYNTNKDGFKGFGKPTVDVPLKYEISAKDAYLYLGDTVGTANLESLANTASGWIVDPGTGFEYSMPTPAAGAKPTADTAYTLRVKVTPASGIGSSTDNVPTVTAKSYTADGTIHVLKPTVPLTDTVIFQGESTDLTNRVGTASWTEKQNSWIAVGSPSAPTLVYEFITPRGTAAVVSSTTVSPAAETHYDVKAYRQDAQDDESFNGYVTYTWSCADAGAEHIAHATPTVGNGWFTVHVSTGTLTITKTIGKNYPVVFDEVDAQQSFVFEVKKDGTVISREVIVPTYNSATRRYEGSVTLVGLPAGTYTVEEDTDWAWRYTPEGDAVQTKVLSSANPNDTANFANTLTNNSWVGDVTSHQNIFR